MTPKHSFPFALLSLSAFTHIALADSFSLLPQPPAAEPLIAPDSIASSPASPSRDFGKDDGSWWFTLGAGIASDLGDDTDYNARISFSTFLAPDFQVGIELSLWAFTQKGPDDPFAINPVLSLRYHFFNNHDWTIFADAGIGLLFSSDDIPSGGSSFNLTPRIGIGFTKLLSDSGTRLEVGARWHHISNARIFGDDQNPSRDLPLLHAAIIFPF